MKLLLEMIDEFRSMPKTYLQSVLGNLIYIILIPVFILAITNVFTGVKELLTASWLLVCIQYGALFVLFVSRVYQYKITFKI